MRQPPRQTRFVAFAALLLLAQHAWAGLFEYVARAEPQSGWEERSRSSSGGIDEITLELVSQVWRGVRWTHELRIFWPHQAALDLGVLVVTGDGRSFIPDERRLAEDTRAVVAVLSNVPNQPLFGGLYEDDLISHTFEQYLRSADPEWPLLLPMTKAAVRAMDAVQDLGRTRGQTEIRRFVVTGASKRGWTSWLTAAVDPRVAGIMPVVFDNLSFGPQLRNQLATWGRYSEQLGDYTGRGLPAFIETARGRELVAMVDPYSYRQRLERVAKLIVNGTNDRYWALDAIRFYWADLGGQKAVLYVPNATHSIPGEGRVNDTLVAFVRRVAVARPLPVLRFADAESWRLVSDEEPVEARLWVATSASRDFRRARWSSRPARHEGAAFEATIEQPQSGFLAVFGEADYSGDGKRFSISTPVEIRELKKGTL